MKEETLEEFIEREGYPDGHTQELLIKLNQMGFKSKSNGSVLDIPKNPKPEKKFLHIYNGKVSFGSPLLLTPNLYKINIDGSIWYEYDYFLNNF